MTPSHPDKWGYGTSPSAYQATYAETGAPRIPGCYVFMHGLSDRGQRNFGEAKSR